MPRISRIYGLPRDLQEEGVLRYGFHGLSYEYIMEELAGTAGEEVARRRTIIAHLGHGASMAAVHNRKSVDTTMGFSPAGGLIMSTRSGDLDPGVVLYLLKRKGMTSDQINDVVNRKSGLLGISGLSDDMKELLKNEREEMPAGEAVDLFCYQAKKFIGSLASALGGLDTLIFTGGIGERASAVRMRICQGLEFIGVEIDPELNESNAPVISGRSGSVAVRVMKTNEELMIARHTHKVLF